MKTLPLLALLLLPLAAGAQTTWTGSTNNSWAEPTNWDVGSVPGAADLVKIPPGRPNYPDLSLSGTPNPLELAKLEIQNGASLSLTGLTLPPEINELDIEASASLDIGGLTLNIGAGGVTSAGDIASANGTIVVTGGDLTQTGGSLSGTVTINTGGNVIQSGGGMAGAVTITANGSIGIDLRQANTLISADLASTGGDIQCANTSGGTLSLKAQASGIIDCTEDDGLVIAAGGLSAGGNITMTAAGGITVNGAVDSTGGAVSVTAADFNVSNPINAADISLTGTAALTVGDTGSMISAAELSNLHAAGTLHIGTVPSFTLTVEAAMSVGSTLTLTGGGGITLNGDVTVTSSGGDLSLDGGGGGITLNAGVTSSGGNITLDGAVTLGAGVTVQSNNGDILCSNTVGGAGKGLTLIAGTGAVTLNGDLGSGGSPLGAVSIAGSTLQLPNVYSESTVAVTGSTVHLRNVYSGGALAITGSTALELGPATVILDSGAGPITLTGPISGAGKNLSLAAGTDITISGAVGGPGARLGTITVQNAGNVEFTNAAVLYAAGFTQTVGTGTTSFAGDVDLNGEDFNHAGTDLVFTSDLRINNGHFRFTGTNLTVNTITGTGTGNSVTITNSGVFTLNGGKSITLASPGGGFSQSGGAAVLGGNLTTNNGPLSFAGALTLAVDVALRTGSGPGNISLAAVNGTSGGEGLTLIAGTGAVILGGSLGTTQPLAFLTIGCGGFTAGPGSTLIRVTGTGVLTAAGDISIASGLDMRGVRVICGGTSSVAIGSALHIQSLRVEAGKAAALASSGTLTIEEDVELHGDLDAGPSAGITVRGDRWIQDGLFYPRNGTVTFTNPTVEIDGLTTAWYNLVFDAAVTEVRFRAYPYAQYDSARPFGHYVRGALRGVPAGGLTRLAPVVDDATDANSLPASALFYDDLSKNHANKFWNLFYDPAVSTVFDALGQTNINWCWVRPTISKDMNIPDTGDWIVPYAPSLSRYNVGWTAPYLIYSFTEDWDHNGRIDHIRVQSSAPMNLDFQNLDIQVSGYTVTGYESLPSGYPFRDYLFYIRLKERDHPDTAQTPSWDIGSPGNLADIGGRPFDLLDSAKLPIDTAPPQVVYSLALPEGNEIFFRMSEPVKFVPGFDPALSISVNGAGGSYALEPVTAGVSGGLLEFKLTRVAPSSLAAADIASEKNVGFAPSVQGYFYDSPASFYYPPLIGSSQLPDCYLIWPKDGRAYEYGGIAGGYEDKAAWSGSVTARNEPNYNIKNGSAAACDYIHRLSDILVAPPPANAAAPFFAQPVYAHDYTGGLNPGSRIFEFDGSKQLLYMEVTIQAKLYNAVAALPFIGGLELRCASDGRIPAEFRSSAEQHGIEGLWLPGPRAPGLTPGPYGEALISKGDPSPGNNLYTFTIPRSALRIGETLEFYFHPAGASSDLFVARLDTVNSSSLPWFRRIKPFAFRVRELIQQRGAVTILNNVINPNRGEHAVLYYLLDQGGRVTVQVFTMDGTLVKVLERSGKEAGDYVVSWDGRNNGGRPVARGLYFIRIVAPDIDEIRKVMVVK